MLAVNTRIIDESQRVVAAAERAGFKNLGHAIATVRKVAQASIKPRPKVASTKTKKTKRDKRGRFLKGSGKKNKRRMQIASPPGTPPFTGRGLIRRAIRFWHDKESAIAGTLYSMIGTAGKPHEDGGPYKGQHYDQRAFMGPALNSESDRFALSFTGSIGE